MVQATVYTITRTAGHSTGWGADTTQPTKEQALAALVRVSRGAVWHHAPQPDPWKHIGDLVGASIMKASGASQ